MSELPGSWEIAPLGALLSGITGGGTPSKANAENFRGSIPFMTVKDMHARFIADTQDHISEQALEESASTLVPADTLVVASRMSLGKIIRPKVPVAINQDLKALFLHQDVNKTYVEYLWKASETRIREMGTGTTVKGIRLEDIRGLPVPVAPSGEQTRIADQLDILLARIKACNDHLDAIPGLLKRFRQAAVSAAMAGKLTEEWPGALPVQAWSIDELHALCEQHSVITYGVVKLGDATPGGTPCLRTSNVRWLKFETDGMKRIAPELSAQYGRTVLKGGEVLVNVRGTLGGVAVAESKMHGWNVSREVAVVPIDAALINPQFTAYWVASAESQRWLARMEKGVAYVGINIEDLRRLPIRYPSKAEQDEIVKCLGDLLSIADRIERRLAKMSERSARLMPQVLDKAFRGDLVPQDPSDEPASALLARLGAERSQAGTSAKTRHARTLRAVQSPKSTASLSKAVPNKNRQDEDVKGQPYLAGHLRRLGQSVNAQTLYEASELPVADFYKQLAWEIAEGHVNDVDPLLEPARHAT